MQVSVRWKDVLAVVLAVSLINAAPVLREIDLRCEKQIFASGGESFPSIIPDNVIRQMKWNRELKDGTSCANAEAAYRVYKAIVAAVKEKKPLLVGKIGITENYSMDLWWRADRGKRPYLTPPTPRNNLKDLYQNSGVYPLTEEAVSAWAEVYYEASKQLDIDVKWHIAHRQAAGEKPKFMVPTISSVPYLSAIWPWFWERPYTNSFRGKTVLVISPFASYIESQLTKNRDCIFPRRKKKSNGEGSSDVVVARVRRGGDGGAAAPAGEAAVSFSRSSSRSLKAVDAMARAAQIKSKSAAHPAALLSSSRKGPLSGGKRGSSMESDVGADAKSREKERGKGGRGRGSNGKDQPQSRRSFLNITQSESTVHHADGSKTVTTTRVEVTTIEVITNSSVRIFPTNSTNQAEIGDAPDRTGAGGGSISYPQFSKFGQSLSDDDVDVLPPFELKTLIPPMPDWSIPVGQYKNAAAFPANTSWMQHYQNISSVLNGTELGHFDVAIIGAGAYGIPLGAVVKALGKVAIVLGGNVGPLFGIRGHRFNGRPEYKNFFYNKCWVQMEKPKGAELMENAAYWRSRR